MPFINIQINLKKKQLILILLAAGLATLAAYFSMRDRSSSIRQELKEFSVTDTVSISKIFIADKSGQSVTLTRNEESRWMLNDSLPPKPDMIFNLLEVIRRVQVKSKVPKSGYNTVVSNLASFGIKCEIYLKGQKKPAKVYYVGGHTADVLGTFMMIENSSMPFVTEIPGFNGYLTPRYNPSPIAWREPVVFREDPDEILSVGVIYSSFPMHSYELRREDGEIYISNPLNPSFKFRADSVLAENYLDLFRNVYYEFIDGKLSLFQKDSILNENPICKISLQKTEGEQRDISIYPMAINENSLTIEDSLGNPLKYDLDRMYAFTQPENEWYVIQHYMFERLLRRIENFLHERDRKSYSAISRQAK
ncbi:MAG: hypothetical protein DWQ44_03310 [Bacteroidetes bacterium]|nr:MAG: hypothetical protein DWQ44_03310 [Bacteroidota bacterium]